MPAELALATPPAAGRVRTSGLLAYGVLGLPLSFAALPIYVHVPQLYAGALGLPLAAVGGVLLACRALDALTDPLIGWASDRIARRRVLTLAGLPLLAAGMLLLLSPPAGAGLAWLAGAVVLATLGYSVSTINYYAWGAELGRDSAQRTAAVASREGFGLLGVVCAAALPGLLSDDLPDGLVQLAWGFVPLLAGCALLSLWQAPAGPRLSAARTPVLEGWRSAWRERPVRRLLLLLAVNGVAAAVPSATVLFFIDDVIGADALAGLFLALYFVCGAAGLPGWLWAARRFGKVSSWAASMVLAMGVFGWAATLGAGDTWPFAVICALSGLALGADLALPPAMLADLLARQGDEARGATWFGLWNLVAKGALALAAGLALPALAWLGYRSGVSSAEGAMALALVYGALPVLLKGAALGALLGWRREFGESR